MWATAGLDHVAANVVSIIAFGVASLNLGVGAHSLEVGQVFVRRREDKAQCGERRLCESESIAASESSGKCQPHTGVATKYHGCGSYCGRQDSIIMHCRLLWHCYVSCKLSACKKR
jgi:hypothetical protein